MAEQANASELAIDDEAERNFEVWCEKRAKEVRWFEAWQTVLGWNPSWATWFMEGKLDGDGPLDHGDRLLGAAAQRDLEADDFVGAAVDDRIR